MSGAEEKFYDKLKGFVKETTLKKIDNPYYRERDTMEMVFASLVSQVILKTTTLPLQRMKTIQQISPKHDRKDYWSSTVHVYKRCLIRNSPEPEAQRTV